MSSVIVNNVSLQYPIFGSNARSLRNDMLKLATGCELATDSKKIVAKALNSISFTLQPGDRLGLVGHNGAGKSTLLRLLAGIYPPCQGECVTRGNIVPILNINAGILPEATGYENIRLKGLLMGMSDQQIEAMIPSIEQFAEMGDYLSLPMKTYSSGMMLRLSFAIATALTPDILLMDEAIGAGDLNFMEKASRRLQEFVDQSDILVIASHFHDVIRRFCNLVLWLDKGSVKAYGPTDEVLAQYEAFCEQKKIKQTADEVPELAQS